VCFLVLLVFGVCQNIADNSESYAILGELMLVHWLLVKELMGLVPFVG
jgi:hypothetical protein